MRKGIKKLVLIVTPILMISGLFLSQVHTVVSASSSDDDVIVPGEGDLFQQIFGSDSIRLNILKPLNYWEGDSSIWVILAVILSNVFIVLFVVLIFMIALGAIRYVSSQGNDAKLQSASKGLKNAVIGFAVTMIMFILINLVTFFLGIGSVFSLAKNLATCEGKVLYEHKREIDEESLPENCTWQCTDAGWECSVSAPTPAPGPTPPGPYPI